MSGTPDPSRAREADLAALRIPASDRPRRSTWFTRMRSLLIWVLGAVLLVMGVKTLLSLRPRTVAVTRVSTLSPVQAATVLTASGYIVARSKAEISPKSVGRIAWINLEEGQTVKKNELVARLESADLEAQRRQIDAQLASARSDYARARKLAEDRVISTQEVERLNFKVSEMQAQLDYVAEQIKNAEIYAPIDGVVTVKKAFLGETVAPQGFGAGSAGATFAVITDLASLEMEADINEANLGKLHDTQPAQVALDAYPDRPYRARLRQIVPTADRQKGAVKVKVELLERDNKVLPEMSARVSFLSEDVVATQAQPRVTVPLASVVTVDGKEGVLSVEGETATFVPLVLGGTNGSAREVKSGIATGATIVTDASTDKRGWRAVNRVVKKED